MNKERVMTGLSTERWLCTIEVENTQQSFAKCLQLVLWLEEIAQYGYSVKENGPEDFLEFFISRVTSAGINNQQTLLNQETLLNMGESRKIKKITDKQMLLAGLKKEPEENVFYYYFRVQLHEEENDITELQYLVLLLQAVPTICNRVAVRLMSTPTLHWNTTDFFRVSHFLRFIQQKYGCFYACYDERLTSLRPLQYSNYGIQSTFLPLLEVNGQLCQLLNKTWFFSSEYQEQKYDKLYTALSPQGCEVGSMTWLLSQIGLRMLFKNLSGKNYRTAKNKQDLLELLCQLINEMQGITPLDLILFGALISDVPGSKLNYAVAKTLIGKVQMLSLAISQILENIVNHSERNQGVFTFRLQKNMEYLKTHYPDYSVVMAKNCLELLVADSNRKDGIVRHFLNSNKADTLVKDLASDVYLAHLFGEYREEAMKEVWKRARENRPEMCHGLISFANSVRSLNGAIRVRSAPYFTSRDFKDIYYNNGTDNDYNNDAFLLGDYIPGTQFSIVVNRLVSDTGVMQEKNDEDWAFDFNKLVYATTYRELAQALTFSEKVQNLELTALLKENSLCPHNQMEKDAATIKWKEWFNSQIEYSTTQNRVVYQCDLDELCHRLETQPELGEPFCKGFLSSHFFIRLKKDVYYSILLQNPSAQFSRIFKATLDVVATLEVLETQNVCVYFYPKQYSGAYLPYCAATLHNLLGISLNDEVFPRVFPYTLFLKDEAGHSIFEQELLKQAETPIYNRESQGFKIPQTHMRLGNKVHIDMFYEMALFFENPNYAYYTAFLFLRNFMSNNADVLQTKEKLLFYGYASYSRAIVWAILQILKQYIKLIGLKKVPQMEFVIYQNDLQLESEQPQIQMYYSQEIWQRKPEEIWDPQDTVLVMIVPISSSLTTFNKMVAELSGETKKNFQAEENYTAFWVRNKYIDECLPTNEEKHFWQEIDPCTKTITSNLVQGKIKYLVSVTSKWSNPLNCPKCFPDDPILEYPLVETDPTSTVPTQQFYRQTDSLGHTVPQNTVQEQQNDMRIARLKSNIIYGHVSHGSNHYQYYIKTREYFQQERDEVASWLSDLRTLAIQQKNPAVISTNCINVLIIPQQANNVEFGQFVYEHYFHGCAESIIINTEKEFRSNLKAEYSGLFGRLRAAIKKTTNSVKFHYVDISVNSGISFNRIVSLISSCMEEVNLDLDNEEQTYEFGIDQVFLLISRLSNDSKRMYVRNPELNFHAYAELHISAMRTFGDSCVPCKLQQEAKRYYKKAATKSISAYWEEKIYDRACIPFDQVQKIMQNNFKLQEEGYQRMMCSHRAAHFIRPIQGADIPAYFLAIRNFLNEILCANSSKQQNTTVAVYREINNNNRKEWLAAGLKIIVRPFFSFDYKMRCAVMDLYLVLGEYLIKKCSIDDLTMRLSNATDKNYLIQNGNLEWIKNFADGLMHTIEENQYGQLEFIRNNILKGLADIKSNYVLRKDTILEISKRVDEVCRLGNFKKAAEEFYSHYLRSILRMTHSSSDETKGVWLEYLLQHGEEYHSSAPITPSVEGIKELVKLVPDNIRPVFRNFLEVLLVENNRPIYQAVVEFDKRKKQKKEKSNDDIVESYKDVKFFLKEYHMRNAASFLSFQQKGDLVERQLYVLRDLLLLLNQKDSSLACYKRLGEKIQKIVESKATDSVGEVILFGNYSENKSSVAEYLNLPNYFALFPERFEDQTEREKSPEKKLFEEHWNQIQSDVDTCDFLNKNGFHLVNIESDILFDVIIKLDNNYADLTERMEVNHQKIEPFYIYIPCHLYRQQALELTRMILMFRQKLIEWLEYDFNNSAIAVLSEQKNLAKLLSTDKMGDHAEDDFVECQQKILMATTPDEFKEELRTNNWEFAVTQDGERKSTYDLDCLWRLRPPLPEVLIEAREWFLLRSYVNSRISRLFRTMVRTGNTASSDKIIDAEIYYARDSQSVMMRPVRKLQTVFFTPTTLGYIRKNYLRQMMKTVTFTVEGVPDYILCEDANVEERLDNLSIQLMDFECINLTSDVNGKEYAYLAEYLATILLDCFISALKAGKEWNQSGWGGKAFEELYKKRASEKCEIVIKREKGGICDGNAFDYLVIQNKIHHHLRQEKKGPGMSQAAIRWYINELWSSCLTKGENHPKVITEPKQTEYIIKLPILKGKTK